MHLSRARPLPHPPPRAPARRLRAEPPSRPARRVARRRCAASAGRSTTHSRASTTTRASGAGIGGGGARVARGRRWPRSCPRASGVRCVGPAPPALRRAVVRARTHARTPTSRAQVDDPKEGSLSLGGGCTDLLLEIFSHVDCALTLCAPFILRPRREARSPAAPPARAYPLLPHPAPRLGSERASATCRMWHALLRRGAASPAASIWAAASLTVPVLGNDGAIVRTAADALRRAPAGAPRACRLRVAARRARTRL